MAKFTAFFQTIASATVTAEVPDDVAAEGAEAISEWLWMNSSSASICAQCSGWGKNYGLELGDFEPSTHEQGAHRGMAYVTDEDGNDFTGDQS